MDDQERYAQGMAVRRKVLGDEWVARATANRTAFTEEWQASITRHPWGDIWTRPGLTLKTRSYITLSLMIALGRWEEFKLHIPAAFNNGLELSDIKEVIMHAAAYVGVPAGNHAFAEASKTLREMGVDLGAPTDQAPGAPGAR